ncbi:MAG: site-specific DNA-methyltransferase [Lachnospiraceae bacterium]|nr:site-specific DNA-methyltransferase [Lachnospiraceae bacterium]
MMLICGNVLDELKKLESNSIDMGVTSPPYNKQENKKGWLVSNVKYDAVSDKKNEDTYQKEQIEVLDELYRIIKPGGSFFYNHKIRWEKGVMLHPIFWLAKSKWHIRQEIIWDRGIAANIRGWRFWQVEERIFWLHKPRDKKDLIGQELESKHALLSSIWRIRPENSNTHPAPFPLALPVRCIYSILGDNGGIVIDPYCGSGTSLVAAQSLGCKFIGIDISENYIKNAEERLQNAEKELKIIESEKALHKITETFSQKKARGMYQNKTKKIESTSIEPDLFSS